MKWIILKFRYNELGCYELGSKELGSNEQNFLAQVTFYFQPGNNEPQF